ncbi:MAG: hypothetical protein U5R06_18390 [candidate division KSB1 bacterium]|nr:hypothetical protein [candidate division KSB1 bacterium]
MKILRSGFQIICFLLVIQVFAQPQWAREQITLRNVTKQLVTETQKWEQDAGGLYYYLNTWKWDDEVEIFYYWLPYYYLTGDQSAYETVKRAGLRYISRATNAGMFHHGYYKEAFYDTEHTLEGLIILANLAYANPTDTDVIKALEDMVEHIGNWVNTCEDWTHEQTGLMRSLRMGTQEIETGNNTAVDWAFNLQFAKLALAAYHSTGKTRYLDWTQRYLNAWIGIMETNEQENGYYVPPCSVDPYTGEIGPYSGVWWQAQYQTGWSWENNGFSSFRDFRVFIDCFRTSKNRIYLNSLSRFLMTLFDNGDGAEPAHYFDGTTWSVRSSKWIAYMGTESSIFNNYNNVPLENAMSRWFKAMVYPYNSMRMWKFLQTGDEKYIHLINDYAIDKTTDVVNQLKAMTKRPSEPDDFPKYTTSCGCALVPFGASTAPRGEMPPLQVVYYRQDQSLGLYEDVAALFRTRTDTTREFSLCNTGTSTRTVLVQSGFIPQDIVNVYINEQEHTVLNENLAEITVPPNSTVDVLLNIDISDVVPPAAPQNVVLQ